MEVPNFLVFTNHTTYLFVVFLGRSEWHIIWRFWNLIYVDVLLLVVRQVIINCVDDLYIWCPFLVTVGCFIISAGLNVFGDLQNLRCRYFDLYQRGRVRDLISDYLSFLQQIWVFTEVGNKNFEGLIVLHLCHCVSCHESVIGEQPFIRVN